MAKSLDAQNFESQLICFTESETISTGVQVVLAEVQTEGSQKDEILPKGYSDVLDATVAISSATPLNVHFAEVGEDNQTDIKILDLASFLQSRT